MNLGGGELATDVLSKATRHRVRIHVKCGDALSIASDVLALKYAQANYGLDAEIVGKYAKRGSAPKFPKPWKVCLVRAP
jgi:hypothetical protein